MGRSRDKLAAAILAGGRASRYHGIDKGSVDAGDGRTILERTLAELALAGLTEVVICANEPTAYASLGRPIVPDRHPGVGPLGGIEAAMAHYAGRYDGTVLLPCDLPGITAAEIGHLAEAFRAGPAEVVVAATGESFWHPLCAVVHNSLLCEVTAAIGAGLLGAGRLWRRLGGRGVHFAEEAALFNVNTPADLRRWREGCSP